MGFKKQFSLLNNQGQSTVEYVLLLAVIFTFLTTVWNSQAFKDFFGEDSKFFNAVAQKVRVNYHFAANVPLDTALVENPILEHPSYVNNGQTRFFTLAEDETYPKP